MAKLAYNQSSDQTLSYSILQELHACPRKFELNHILKVKEEQIGGNTNVDFAFGHAVAAGCQEYLSSGNENLSVLAILQAWDVDYEAVKPKAKKSFYEAIFAFEKFKEFKETYLGDFELAYFIDKEGKKVPAIELTFKINLSPGYNYQGHVDAVLRHKLESYLVVVELKTTSSLAPDEANYSNSSQALGYSIALNEIAKSCLGEGISGYDVIYPVYSSSAREWTYMPFHKNIDQRLDFINDLLFDINTLKMYKEENYYPKRGSSCMDFFRRCEHYDICNLSNKNLSNNKVLNQFDHIEEEDISFVFSLRDVLEQQRVTKNTQSMLSSSKYDTLPFGD